MRMESRMRKLIVAAMVSLDGVMQAPGGPEEDTSGGFAYGGWAWPFADAEEDAMGGVFKHPFELVLGRRTYDIFAAYWPHVPKGAPHQHIADLFNGTTKHVATHHPGTLAWQNSRALGPDVIAAVRTLKHADGADLLTQGSSNLLINCSPRTWSTNCACWSTRCCSAAANACSTTTRRRRRSGSTRRRRRPPAC